jgi:hypothetical protein
MLALGLARSSPVGFAARVVDDLAARRLRRVLGIAGGAQCSAVEDRPVVKVEQEDGCVGSDGIELVDGRQAPLGELMFGEAADDPHPLRWRRDGDLPLEHAHRIGERPHAVPAQLHVEVEPATDDVEVIVDQSRQCAAALQVNAARVRAGKRHDFGICSHNRELAVFDRHRTGRRIGAVEGREETSMQDDIGCIHESISFDLATTVSAWSDGWPGSTPKICAVQFDCRQATWKAEPSNMCLPTGMICSPTSMPTNPTSATSGGAGERTFSRL